MHPSRSLPRSQRASVLIVALLLCTIIGISLVSYYRLAASALTGATRSFLSLSNINLAEIGLEHAMACFYDQSTGTPSGTAWNGWNAYGTTGKQKKIAITDPAPNCPAEVRVYVNNFNGSSGTPVIVAQATISPPRAAPIHKFVEVTLRNRGLWTNGIVARDSITGDSNLVVDSWQSNTTSPASLYSTTARKAGGPIGVIAAGSRALAVGDNPTIYGAVKTGGGSVSKSGAAKLSNVVGGSGWNAALETHDFAFTFPTITVPTPSRVNLISGSLTISRTFPNGTTDQPASDGKYYYDFQGYNVDYASKTMTVSDRCVFLMTAHAAFTNSFTTSSSATYTYGNSTATLEIYTSGSMHFDSGASWFANGVPARCMIYMTASSGSQFHTGGGGTWNACIYGPNTAFNLDSGGTFNGSVIMKSCTLRGGVKFHYDESLGSLGSGSGVAVARWKELQSADERAVYSAPLNF